MPSRPTTPSCSNSRSAREEPMKLCIGPSRKSHARYHLYPSLGQRWAYYARYIDFMLREPAASSARSTELLRPPVRSAVLQGPSANLRTACSGLRTRSENTRRRKISSMKRFMRCRRTWRAFPSGWSAAASLRHPGTPSTVASSRSPLVLTVSTCYMVVGGSLSYLQVPGESPGYFFIHSIRSPHWPRSSASLSTRATQGHARLLLLVRPQTSHFLYNVRLPTQSVRRPDKANGTHGAQHLLRHG